MVDLPVLVHIVLYISISLFLSHAFIILYNLSPSPIFRSSMIARYFANDKFLKLTTRICSIIIIIKTLYNLFYLYCGLNALYFVTLDCDDCFLVLNKTIIISDVHRYLINLIIMVNNSPIYSTSCECYLLVDRCH